ncbi:MAG: beta-galactosidase [Gorillibacterium sp.]|nr:beta-galactosidase [Gorillibacterium sp.]
MTVILSAVDFHPAPKTRLQAEGEHGIVVDVAKEGGGIELDGSHFKRHQWQDYSYFSADVYHESHDVLVLVLMFCEPSGRSLSVHYGMLPGVRTRICLPLSALAGGKLFLDRYPGVLQSVVRGDPSVDRSQISAFSISTIASVEGRHFTLSGVQLSHEEPEFSYEFHPYIDELGQWSKKEWHGKTVSPAAMTESLREEWERSQNHPYDRVDKSRYGGWKGICFTATGFFRTELLDGIWWLVDPDGYGLFSAGMDCIQPYDTMRVSGMEHLTPPLPEQDGPFREAWAKGGFSYSVANLIQTFGEAWKDRWAELTEYRLWSWGFNTIGNWSDAAFIGPSSLPYVYPMEGFPETKETIFRDFPDVFSPEYEENAKAFAAGLLPLRDDPRLVGYFMRNEPHWAFVDSLNLTELLIAHSEQLFCKQRLVEWLETKYETVERLNDAWGTSLNSFSHLTQVPFQLPAEEREARKNDYAAFDRLLIRRYVEVPAGYCKEVDPHHLNLGMRYAWVSSEAILEGCEAFDVFSINCYQSSPDKEQIASISKHLSRPVMIGEFHFGAADAGLPACGIRAVATQEARGRAYRYYVEQSAAIPELVGIHYFQYPDQPVLGRFDGENYQIGLVDVCQRPYSELVEQATLAHERMYRVRTGNEIAFDKAPAEVPKTGF